ncbi:hypothetical protein IV500_05035 [Paeniglutamicibacter antarcticus]|uniref:Uncharacterized protein n=1 Tax=Arthrobacter terrae TaxID=2935737 RepID=A0A931CI73_9MICC|nr:hypothetical protein [Arthrobacter terrae]MBG0738783.1 hypothetical protein [Arthrobacter terrae]
MSAHMGSMTDNEYTPRMRAMDRIARSIAEHRSVRRTNGIGSTCKNPVCRGVIFLNLNDWYRHQAAVLVNDLQRELDFYTETVHEDARAEGREATAEELSALASQFLVLGSVPSLIRAADDLLSAGTIQKGSKEDV